MSQNDVLMKSIKISSIEAMERLGTAVKRKRSELGLSQRDTADLLNVSQSAIRYWENKTCLPDPDKWAALANFFGYESVSSFVAFIFDEENNNTDPACVKRMLEHYELDELTELQIHTSNLIAEAVAHFIGKAKVDTPPCKVLDRANGRSSKTTVKAVAEKATKYNV